jgi:hypothetical protein
MPARIVILFGVLTAICLFLAPFSAQAASGMPQSSKFGYGVVLNLDGNQVEAAIQVANDFKPDWIAIEFDWARYQPNIDQFPDWERLDAAMFKIGDIRSAVMISITHAPAWAMTEQGPDPERCSELVHKLVMRYSGILLALELFPGANTTLGWGTTPHPGDYARLLQTTYDDLQEADPRVVLISGGLVPVKDNSPAQVDDILFLRRLYEAGAVAYLPVVGIRLGEIVAEPLASPIDAPTNPVLRHYEAIRNEMLAHGHQSGLIWITGFSWNPQTWSTIEEQAIWIRDSFTLLRAQLYLGTAFFQGLNPPSPEQINSSLIGSDGSQSPALLTLKNLIIAEHNADSFSNPLSFLKSISGKKPFKGN